ncbi:Rieske (2Fe-2S) protein [Oryzibacter oryziterrae]|uniref:Rieske (2Fe-2S) protein n=1 Tax=Oryzibacter oryziterrae TaxID=2766474 RepID=UPI001F3DFB74|nr:Rieske (2Fe-2S) protein [Oryzibacter oryziterrae]
MPDQDPDSGASASARLCPEAEIVEGAARGFDLGEDGVDTMFVVRTGGVLRGWRNACPHIDGAPMAWRKDAYLNADGSRIVCHAHGAEFLPETGLCVSGPCLGRSLTSVPLTLGVDGFVLAEPRK